MDSSSFFFSLEELIHVSFWPKTGCETNKFLIAFGQICKWRKVSSKRIFFWIIVFIPNLTSLYDKQNLGKTINSWELMNMKQSLDKLKTQFITVLICRLRVSKTWILTTCKMFASRVGCAG